MVYVGVAAQRLGVEASPAGLKQYDPVRYGSLKHPGDDYSFDIFTQAAEAALDPKVLGALRPYVARRLASGASQSGGRLLTYINSHQQHVRVFDGFQPQISSASGVNRKLVPIVWVNSQAEVPATPLPADSDLFRLWELAGPAHTTSSSSDYQNEMLIYSHSNGNAGSYDHESSGSWGYGEDPGTCFSKNWFQPSYLWSAAIVALDEWVRTGIAPQVLPRAGRDAAGDMAFDSVGNMVGGVRLPIVDVPIGAYFAGDSPAGSTDPCAVAGARVPLSGFSKVLDAATLKALYPTAQTYVEKFDAATAAAVAAGALLPEGATDLKRRALIAAMWLESVT